MYEMLLKSVQYAHAHAMMYSINIHAHDVIHLHMHVHLYARTYTTPHAYIHVLTHITCTGARCPQGTDARDVKCACSITMYAR